MRKYKLLIVGAGPAGISLVMEARNAGLSSDEILIIDKAEAHSWVIRSLYPDKKLVTANYKGMPAVCHGVMCLEDSSKKDTINYLDKAIKNTGVKVNYREEVLKIEHVDKNGDEFFNVITNKNKYESKIVVIAIGIFGKPNKPDYKLPLKLKNKIHFDITSFFAKGESVLVVGGGDSASEFAQYLVEMGNKVTLSYRRKEFIKMNAINRKSLIELAHCGKVSILFESNIFRVEVSESKTPLVYFKEGHFGMQEFDRIVYALGGSTPENFLKSTGIDFCEDTPKLKEDGETNIKGLFVGGDLLAGKKGGSISHAFNSSRLTMEKICRSYLDCEIANKTNYFIDL